MNLVDFKVVSFPSNSHINIKGENEKKIFVFYKKSKNEAEELAFLKKVIGAVKVDFDKDIGLIGLGKDEQMSFSNLLKNHSIKTVLLFGLPLKNLGLHFEIPNYYILPLQKRNFLCADALGTLMKDNRRKRQLWEALKRINF